MVIWRSLVGLWFSLKMAISVRRCRSVKTSLVRLGPWLRSILDCSCSLRLQAKIKNREKNISFQKKGKFFMFFLPTELPVHLCLCNALRYVYLNVFYGTIDDNKDFFKSKGRNTPAL